MLFIHSQLLLIKAPYEILKHWLYNRVQVTEGIWFYSCVTWDSDLLGEIWQQEQWMIFSIRKPKYNYLNFYT